MLVRVSTTHGSNYVPGGATTIAAAAASHVTGNLLVVGVRSGSGTVTTTVTDTAGNTYRRIGHSSGSSTSTLQLWFANNITGNASNVVTATFSSALQFRGIVVVEYSGQATATPVMDAMPGILGERTLSVNTQTTPPFTTVVADEVIVVLTQVDATGTTWTPGAGLSTAVQDASQVVYLADQIVSSIQTNTTRAVTNSTGSGKDILCATFTAAVDTGGSGSPGDGSPGASVETGFAHIG